MKINPFLNHKFLGLSVHEILGIGCAVISAQAFDDTHHFDSNWIRWGLWALFWIIGMVGYNIVIALIKTYITKEE